MVEPFHSVSLTTHPCYTFQQRMVNCLKTEEMPTRMCVLETEDWYECKGRKKHRAFHNFISTELNRHKIYSLPSYDPNTDTFKDGRLPKDVDTYFGKGKDQQTYYS